MPSTGEHEGDHDSRLLTRKRARDRKAQRHARQKQNRYIQELQDMVSFCKQHHRSPLSQYHRSGHAESLDDYSHKTETTDSRHPSQLACTVRPESDRFVTFRVNLPHTARLPPAETQGIVSVNSKGDSDLQDCELGERVFPASASLTTLDEGVARLPWYLLPLTYQDSSLSRSWCPWMSCPDVVSSLPDIPSPRDLLHGSETNAIANSIHIALSTQSYRLVEKFAVGYLVYVQTKWMLQPSKERYLRLPVFLRPTRLQLQRRHQPMYDGLVWPHLRDNLIESSLDNDIEPIFRLFSRCLRCSWSEHAPFISTDASQRIAIEPAFLQTINSIQAWYLTPDFGIRYPDLLASRDAWWTPRVGLLSEGRDCVSLRTSSYMCKRRTELVGSWHFTLALGISRWLKPQQLGSNSEPISIPKRRPCWTTIPNVCFNPHINVFRVSEHGANQLGVRFVAGTLEVCRSSGKIIWLFANTVKAALLQPASSSSFPSLRTRLGLEICANLSFPQTTTIYSMHLRALNIILQIFTSNKRRSISLRQKTPYEIPTWSCCSVIVVDLQSVILYSTAVCDRDGSTSLPVRV